MPDTTVEQRPLLALAKGDLGKHFALGAGLAVAIGIMAAVWSGQQAPDYRVLMSGYSDKDGGAIIAALDQLGVPYKLAETGQAILVPADRVHNARLQLASQGLPKSETNGFELMENQKLGTSQFLEQVNFQRALEGELARSIQALDPVETARVHLAIPKPSVFVRDRQAPTASVVVQLPAGRRLNAQQVQSIVHLVASSVPSLDHEQVTVVDQNGRLLSSKEAGLENGPDPSHLKYQQDLQADIVKRVESILVPMMGQDNIRAEAAVDVDFTRIDQASELHTPNGKPEAAVIRQQVTREQTLKDGQGAQGIAGAAANQPGEAEALAEAAPAEGGTVLSRDQSTQYEIDKTIRLTQQPMGGLRRLTVAVLLNNRREVAADGTVSQRPLTEAELAQATALVKQAVGYSEERGDTVTVTNTAFAAPTVEPIPEVPFYQPYLTVDNGMAALQTLGSLLLMLLVYLKVVRPILRKVLGPPETQPKALKNAKGSKGKALADAEGDEDGTVTELRSLAELPAGAAGVPALPGAAAAEPEQTPLQKNLATAKALALQEPRVVATVVKNWVGGEA